MRSASWLALLAATACLAGCGSGGSGPPGAVSRTASTSIAPPPVAAGTETSTTPAGPAPGAPDGDTEPHARRSQLSTARAAAGAFFETYVAYLSGRLPAARVADVSPALRAQLESGRAETTPAESASHARIGRVHVAIAGPPVSVRGRVRRTGARSAVAAQCDARARRPDLRVVAVGG